jgi:hypothetical protein
MGPDDQASIEAMARVTEYFSTLLDKSSKEKHIVMSHEVLNGVLNLLALLQDIKSKARIRTTIIPVHYEAVDSLNISPLRTATPSDSKPNMRPSPKGNIPGVSSLRSERASPAHKRPAIGNMMASLQRKSLAVKDNLSPPTTTLSKRLINSLKSQRLVTPRLDLSLSPKHKIDIGNHASGTASGRKNSGACTSGKESARGGSRQSSARGRDRKISSGDRLDTIRLDTGRLASARLPSARAGLDSRGSDKSGPYRVGEAFTTPRLHLINPRNTAATQELSNTYASEEGTDLYSYELSMSMPLTSSSTEILQPAHSPICQSAQAQGLAQSYSPTQFSLHIDNNTRRSLPPL